MNKIIVLDGIILFFFKICLKFSKQSQCNKSIYSLFVANAIIINHKILVNFFKHYQKPRAPPSFKIKKK